MGVKMKVLSIAIPSYNSQDYMANCIESLLVGGEDVEILVVDDGSKDNTAKIADEYAAKYPTIVRAIHQENGGHGEAVNAGIRNATGVFYKVVDSDDKVDADALRQILAKLKEFIETDEAGNAHGTLDLLVSNFIYDKQGAKHKKVMQYRKYIEPNKVLHWEDLRKMPMGKYILMHSVIYRTQLLRDCGLELPKHTFYCDNIFVFEPLPYVKTIYYLNLVSRPSYNSFHIVMRVNISIRQKHNNIACGWSKNLKYKSVYKYRLSIIGRWLHRITDNLDLHAKRKYKYCCKQNSKYCYSDPRKDLLYQLGCNNLLFLTER